MPPSGTSKLTPLSASLAGASPCAAYSLTRSRISIAASAIARAFGRARDGAVKGQWLPGVVKAVLTMFRAAPLRAHPLGRARWDWGISAGRRLQARPSQLERAACALLAAMALAAASGAGARPGLSDSEIVDAQGGPPRPGTMANVTDMDFGDIAMPAYRRHRYPGTRRRRDLHRDCGLIRTGPVPWPRMFDGLAVRTRLVRIRNMTGHSHSPHRAGRGDDERVPDPRGIRHDPAPAATASRPLRALPDQFRRRVRQFFIGGTLNVADTQAAGTYTGTFTIQVLFN